MGIDESFTRTGIAIVSEDGVIDFCNIDFKNCKDKTLKRAEVKKKISEIVEHYNPDVIVCERIRLFSQSFLSINYIKATASLVSTIVDAVYPNPVYSVDTQVWKARVCGHKKGKRKGDKEVSVRYVFNRYNLWLNDDVSDAICIALMGLNFTPSNKLFKKEE